MGFNRQETKIEDWCTKGKNQVSFSSKLKGVWDGSLFWGALWPAISIQNSALCCKEYAPWAKPAETLWSGQGTGYDSSSLSSAVDLPCDLVLPASTFLHVNRYNPPSQGGALCLVKCLTYLWNTFEKCSVRILYLFISLTSLCTFVSTHVKYFESNGKNCCGDTQKLV